MSDRQHAKPWNGPDLSEPGSDVLWSKNAGAERGGVSSSRLKLRRATTHTATQVWDLSIGSIHGNLDVGFVIGLRTKAPVWDSRGRCAGSIPRSGKCTIPKKKAPCGAVRQSLRVRATPTLYTIGFETNDRNEKQRGSCGHQILTANMVGLCEAPCGAAVDGSGRRGPADEPRGGAGSRQAAGPAAICTESERPGMRSIDDAAGNPPTFAPGITTHTRQQDGTQMCPDCDAALSI